MPKGSGRSKKASRPVAVPASPSASAPRASASPHHNSTTAALEARLRQAEAMVDIHAAAVASRPKNTRNAYEPRQKEWRAWCEAEGFDETTRCVFSQMGREGCRS